MKLAIKVFRKVKANLIRVKFHYLFEPVAKVLLPLMYLSKISKWISKTPMPEFNDFYSKRHDYNKRYDLYDHVVKSESLSKICYLEFGVAEGHSFKWWVRNIMDKNSVFVGFDTFTGLPEDWGYFKKGDMSAKDAMPDLNDSRCRFVKGIFQETLPVFLKGFSTNLRKVIHMDADIYNSTIFALASMGPLIEKDDILIFDEFNVPMHEFKAFSEFVNSFCIRVKVIGTVNNFYQIAFKIEENRSCL